MDFSSTEQFMTFQIASLYVCSTEQFMTFQIASLFACGVVFVVIMAIGPLFYDLPKVCLTFYLRWVTQWTSESCLYEVREGLPVCFVACLRYTSSFDVRNFVWLFCSITPTLNRYVFRYHLYREPVIFRSNLISRQFPAVMWSIWMLPFAYL